MRLRAGRCDADTDTAELAEHAVAELSRPETAELCPITTGRKMNPAVGPYRHESWYI